MVQGPCIIYYSDFFGKRFGSPENVSRGLGKARGSLLAHGCWVSLFFFLSSRLASQAHLPLRASWSSGRWNFFFSSAFSNLLVGIPLVGMCHHVVYMYACAVEKKPQKEKIYRSQSTNQSAELNERLPDLCFAICRFSQVRFITPSHLTHNLFFYFQ